jgi:proton-dependent oligopeptide transporter, POT family
MYAALAIVGFIAGCIFFVCFRKGRKWEGNTVILEAVPVYTGVGTVQGQDYIRELEKGV